MRIRLADRVVAAGEGVRDASGHVCRWCGFRCVGGTTAYLDDDGPTRACSICLRARHAGDLGSSFAFAWIPEIRQIDLAHFYRTAAMTLAVFGEAAEPPSVRDERSTRIRDLLLSLGRRRNSVEPILRLEGGLAASLAALPHGDAERLLTGLRVVPTSIEAEEIDLWLDGDSSLTGYGFDVVRRNHWFQRSDELLPPPPPVAAPEPEPKAASKPPRRRKPPREADESEDLAALLQETEA